MCIRDRFNADCEGDEVEIGFNNRYLLDALRNARTEKVRMEISGPLSPVKVPVSYTHLAVYKRQVYRNSCPTQNQLGVRFW